MTRDMTSKAGRNYIQAVRLVVAVVVMVLRCPFGAVVAAARTHRRKFASAYGIMHRTPGKVFVRRYLVVLLLPFRFLAPRGFGLVVLTLGGKNLRAMFLGIRFVADALLLQAIFSAFWRAIAGVGTNATTLSARTSSAVRVSRIFVERCEFLDGSAAIAWL